MRKSIRLFAAVNGETGTWRTLSKAEWDYILKTRDNASSLRAWKGLDGGTHNGLVILPDGTDASVMSGITATADLAPHCAALVRGYRVQPRWTKKVVSG